MPPRDLASLPKLLPRLREGRAQRALAGRDHAPARRRPAAAGASGGHRPGEGLPLLATNDALYAEPAQRDLQDILTCIREGVTIASAGRPPRANAERHLKTPAEMRRLFADQLEAVRETQDFLARIDFSLDQLRYEYPDETTRRGRRRRAGLRR